MTSVNGIMQAKLNMVNGLLKSKRVQALAPTQSFAGIYNQKLGFNAVQNTNSPVESKEPQRPDYNMNGRTGGVDTNTAALPLAYKDFEDTTGNMQQYESLIRQAAEKYGVNEELIKSVMKSESGFRLDAVSRSGAMGLMQLMPGTASDLGVVNPFDPVQNIDGGVRYLKKMLDRFDGDVALALAGYNAGPRTVENLEITNSSDLDQFTRLASNVQRYAGRIMGRIGLDIGARVDV